MVQVVCELPSSATLDEYRELLSAELHSLRVGESLTILFRTAADSQLQLVNARTWEACRNASLRAAGSFEIRAGVPSMQRLPPLGVASPSPAAHIVMTPRAPPLLDSPVFPPHARSRQINRFLQYARGREALTRLCEERYRDAGLPGKLGSGPMPSVSGEIGRAHV